MTEMAEAHKNSADEALKVKDRELEVFLDKMHYRFLDELQSHAEYARRLSLKDTDPKKTDFSDVIQNSSLIMLSHEQLSDLKLSRQGISGIQRQNALLKQVPNKGNKLMQKSVDMAVSPPADEENDAPQQSMFYQRKKLGGLHKFVSDETTQRI